MKVNAQTVWFDGYSKYLCCAYRKFFKKGAGQTRGTPLFSSLVYDNPLLLALYKHVIYRWKSLELIWSDMKTGGAPFLGVCPYWGICGISLSVLKCYLWNWETSMVIKMVTLSAWPNKVTINIIGSWLGSRYIMYTVGPGIFLYGTPIC